MTKHPLTKQPTSYIGSQVCTIQAQSRTQISVWEKENTKLVPSIMKLAAVKFLFKQAFHRDCSMFSLKQIRYGLQTKV